MPEEFIVTPYEVSGEIDYDALVERFGTKRIDEPLLKRLGSYGPVHPMIRRGIFYSHRDLDWILDQHDRGDGFFLYTGRGPSGQTHVGHLLPWILCAYLQKQFGAKFYFQLTDDEKFLFNSELELADTHRLAYDNILDILALGVDPKKTRVIIDTEVISKLYPIALRVARRITFSTAKAVFGFTTSHNIGSIFFTSVQSAPCFLESELEGRNIACLIPCGIDQDPHFRVTRDVAEALGYYKPALIHNKLLPGLGGQAKMSSSKPEGTIYTTDSEKVASQKVRNAFTGGRATVEEQRRLGANPEICPVFSYYTYLFEPDDRKLAQREEECRTGKLMCGECKGELAGRVTTFLARHQEARERAKAHVESVIFRG